MTDPETDPVCGMQIASAAAVASAVTEGQRFLFCCSRCHAAFLDTPHRFVGWTGIAPHAPSVRDGWSSGEAAAQPPIARDLAPCPFESWTT